jgi:hypothetical protein
VVGHFRLQWREQSLEEPFEIHANSTRRSTSGMSGRETDRLAYVEIDLIDFVLEFFHVLGIVRHDLKRGDARGFH